MNDKDKAEAVFLVNWVLYIVALGIIWWSVNFWACFGIWLAIQTRTSGAKHYQELIEKLKRPEQ